MRERFLFSSFQKIKRLKWIKQCGHCSWGITFILGIRSLYGKYWNLIIVKLPLHLFLYSEMTTTSLKGFLEVDELPLICEGLISKRTMIDMFVSYNCLCTIVSFLLFFFLKINSLILLYVRKNYLGMDNFSFDVAITFLTMNLTVSFQH